MTNRYEGGRAFYSSGSTLERAAFALVAVVGLVVLAVWFAVGWIFTTAASRRRRLEQLKTLGRYKGPAYGPAE